tara:strand:- start:4250 stop:5110 length:861 start_codon:yes stop_codon:yes gene_type:complete
MFRINVLKYLKSTIVAITVLSLSLVTFSSAYAGKLEDLRKRGYANVAVFDELPYSSISDDGSAIGAGPDVARAVLNKLGIFDIRPIYFGYGQMAKALKDRRVDIVAAGLYITPSRCELVIYSQPDLCGAEAFLVKKGNLFNIRNYRDIASNRIILMTTCEGCAEETYALERGVAPYQIVIMDSPKHGIELLQQDEVDVFALSGLGISAIMKEINDPNLEIILPVRGVPMSCGAAAFNKDDKEFRDAYDKVLAEMKESGEFAEIVEPYGFSGTAATYVLREDYCPDN